MASVTKTRVDEGTLAAIAAATFPGSTLAGARELSGGVFNASWLLQTEDGRRGVLKVAPRPDVRVQSHERRAMSTEVTLLGLVDGRVEVDVPHVLHADGSLAVCPAPFMVTDVMRGRPLSDCLTGMDADGVAAMHVRLGQLTAAVGRVTCDRFGIPASPAVPTAPWSAAFTGMMRSVWGDARSVGVDLGIRWEDVESALHRDAGLLDLVALPRLVHFDLWEGNVFVEDGEVTGLIDWERALWGDPLMEFGFRSWRRTPEYVAGYLTGCGRDPQGGLSADERRRMAWYDLHLTAIIALENAFRRSGNPQVSEWALQRLPGAWRDLTGQGPTR